MSTLSIAIHAILGIFAFGALQFPGMYFAQIAASGNVGAIRQAFPIAQTRGKIFGPLTIVVALLGIWVAVQHGIPLTTGWLVASYVTYAIMLIVGLGFHSRWEAKINALAQASPLDAPSPELQAAINDPLEKTLKWVSAVGWIVLFYFMIAKPF